MLGVLCVRVLMTKVVKLVEQGIGGSSYKKVGSSVAKTPSLPLLTQALLPVLHPALHELCDDHPLGYPFLLCAEKACVNVQAHLYPQSVRTLCWLQHIGLAYVSCASCYTVFVLGSHVPVMFTLVYFSISNLSLSIYNALIDSGPIWVFLLSIVVRNLLP